MRLRRIAVFISAKVPYDFARDFTPVTLMAGPPWIAVVRPGVPVKSLRELVALAKTRPGKLDHASAGTGTSTYLVTVRGSIWRRLRSRNSMRTSSAMSRATRKW